jgi:hypothetical protein
MFVLGIVLFVVGIPLLLIPIIGLPVMLAGSLLILFGFLKGGARLGLGIGKVAAKGVASAGRATIGHATMKRCPDCAGQVPNAANVCLACGYRYPPVAAPNAVSPRPETPWTPTHRVPDEGMAAWAAPDPSLPAVVNLDGRLGVVVSERAGDWARVEAVNAWSGWVDGRRLVPSA